MTDFKSGYFTMQEKHALEYVKSTHTFFKPDAKLVCKEIGDGNLNYIFKIWDEESGASVILKQAGPVARISDEFKVSVDRNRIESDILQLQHLYVPQLAPIVHQHDPVMRCFLMDDLSDFQILRKALIEHKKFPHFAEHLSTFMAYTLFFTSDLVMDHKKKKELVKNFINPDLCEITEDLVFTEPFYDCSRNDIFEPLKSFAANVIWADESLLLEAAKLKFNFMTNAQALLHGDLHTGSIFVKEEYTKVIDPEFAFYGPAGYDLGTLAANFIFAYENAEATIGDPGLKQEYKNWLAQVVIEMIDLFKDKFMHLLNTGTTEKTAHYKGFAQYYLDGIVKDAGGFAGCELIRRVIGIAHVADTTGISDENKRLKAEKICLMTGKRLILESASIKRGVDFINILKQVEAALQEDIGVSGGSHR